MEATRVVFTQPGVAQLQKRELAEPSGDKVLVKTEYTVVSGGTERAYLLGMPNTRQVFPTGIGYCGIGQIGIGHNHGAARMQTLRKFPELFAIVGYAPESEQWEEKRGSLPAYEGIPRLTAEEIVEKSDAVLVETEISLLTATAQKCVNAGKHVLMDKPAGGTLEEFGHLLQTAKEKKLVLQLGYMYRYNPAVKNAWSCWIPGSWARSTL